MFYDIYTKAQIAFKYYQLIGKPYETVKQASDQWKQDANIDIDKVKEIIDEGYAIQKSMLKEAKKRKK